MMSYYFASMMGAIASSVGGAVLLYLVIKYLFIKQKKGQDETAPPLDMVDGKKLDAMVEDQIKKALKPLLTSDGYSDQEISSILTRTSSGIPRFRR